MRGGKSAVAVDWCHPNGGRSATTSHALAVTEGNRRVVVYDTRKLTTTKGAGKSSATAANPAVLHISEARSSEILETTIFGPGNGKHLISASQLYETDNTSELCIWDWTQSEKRSGNPQDEFRVPAHSEAIYTMALSPDGTRLATGGADAIVGVWDTDTMICTHTIPRRTKYIRTVTFSNDGQILAHASEENDIELVQASNGKPVGQVNLGHRRGGAESLAWHPTLPYLACARMDSQGSNVCPVAIAKLNLSNSQ